MRILFISDNFPPEVNAPATRTYEHARRWVERGAEVTVVTCFPNFPHGRVYEGYRNRWRQTEVVDGITVVRVWSYIAANAGFAKRIADYVSFATTGLLAGLSTRADVIVGTSPQFFAAVSARALGRMSRTPWVMEVRDLWPESIRAVGAMKSGRTLDQLERLELSLYRSARHVVVVTDSFRENLVRRGVPDEKISVVKNGVHVDAYAQAPVGTAAALRRDLGIGDDEFVVGYIGTHGMAHALDFVVRAATRLPSSVKVLLVGAGAQRDHLLALRAELGLEDRVIMRPPVPKSEVPTYIHAVDAALVNLARSVTFLSVIPSKIFENAAARKPILLGVAGESKALIEQYDCGLAYGPEDTDEFVQAVERLSTDEALYARLQTGCTRIAEAFDREQLADGMLSTLARVAGVELPGTATRHA